MSKGCSSILTFRPSRPAAVVQGIFVHYQLSRYDKHIHLLKKRKFVIARITLAGLFIIVGHVSSEEALLVFICYSSMPYAFCISESMNSVPSKLAPVKSTPERSQFINFALFKLTSDKFEFRKST